MSYIASRIDLHFDNPADVFLVELHCRMDSIEYPRIVIRNGTLFSGGFHGIK